ncbi:hypothetical protein XENOCAPTIV_026079 [Xenoophorus captivus]|uniref:Uncharacterized protein n=1 Tax=Xenoophorus captivus TaxID=1517983 RepID=A0ABV0QK66_9TELE
MVWVVQHRFRLSLYVLRCSIGKNLQGSRPSSPKDGLEQGSSSGAPEGLDVLNLESSLLWDSRFRGFRSRETCLPVFGGCRPKDVLLVLFGIPVPRDAAFPPNSLPSTISPQMHLH